MRELSDRSRTFFFVMALGFLIVVRQNDARCQQKMDKGVPPVLQQSAVLETSMGVLEVQLLPDKAPKAVENFVSLADRGFFDGMRFHRVVRSTLIQAGDEKSKDPSKVREWGTGGRSIWGKGFDDEINLSDPLYKEGYKRGMVVTVNRGPRTNTSQFMVLAKDVPFWPRNYVIFGMVTRGQEIVDAIANVKVVPVLNADDGRPEEDVLLKRVVVKSRSASKITQVSQPDR